MISKVPRRRLLKALGLAACSPLISRLARAGENEWVLGFGSCMDGRKSQNFWDAILARSHNQWLFLGDNLYPQTDTLHGLKAAYEELACSEKLAQLKARVPVRATWDDHDFGADNADSSLPFRSDSIKLFREFWQQSYASEDDGVYSSQMFEHQGRRIHLIVLDTRFNRTAYQSLRINDEQEEGSSQPDTGAACEPTLLGARQWQWLEAELEKPAELKIIGSSIQVLSFQHRFEKWKNYEGEYQRLLGLLGRISSPTVLLSGDRHLHEISKIELVSGRALYDFTSSGLNKAEGLSRFEHNRLRVERCLADGFGEVRVAWHGNSPVVTMSMIDQRGNLRFSQSDVLV